MKNKKLKLTNLQVKSFIIPLKKNEEKTIDGGIVFNGGMVLTGGGLLMGIDDNWTPPILMGIDDDCTPPILKQSDTVKVLVSGHVHIQWAREEL